MIQETTSIKNFSTPFTESQPSNPVNFIPVLTQSASSISTSSQKGLLDRILTYIKDLFTKFINCITCKKNVSQVKENLFEKSIQTLFKDFFVWQDDKKARYEKATTLEKGVGILIDDWTNKGEFPMSKIYPPLLVFHENFPLDKLQLEQLNDRQLRSLFTVCCPKACFVLSMYEYTVNKEKHQSLPVLVKEGKIFSSKAIKEELRYFLDKQIELDRRGLAPRKEKREATLFQTTVDKILENVVWFTPPDLSSKTPLEKWIVLEKANGNYMYKNANGPTTVDLVPIVPVANLSDQERLNLNDALKLHCKNNKELEDELNLLSNVLIHIKKIRDPFDEKATLLLKDWQWNVANKQTYEKAPLLEQILGVLLGKGEFKDKEKILDLLVLIKHIPFDKLTKEQRTDLDKMYLTSNNAQWALFNKIETPLKKKYTADVLTKKL